MTQDFETYLQQARTEFCLVAHKYNVTEHNELRTAIDSLLVAYDQAFLALRKHIVMQAEGSDVSEGATGASSAAGKGVCDGCGNYNIHCTCWQNSKDDFMQQFK